MRSWILTAILAATSAAALAQPKSTSEKVADLLGHTVPVVVRIDLQKLDIEALAKLAEDALADEDMPAEIRTKVAQALPMAKAIAGTWRKQMLDAGGREIFVLVDVAGIPQSPLVLAVATTSGRPRAETIEHYQARVKRMSNLLRFGRADADEEARPPAPWPDARQKGEMLLLGRAGQLDRLLRARPARRPNLLAAMQAGQDAAVSAVLAPSPLTRRVIREIARPVRKPLRIDPAEIIQDLRWVNLRVRMQPGPAVELQIQAADAQGARSLKRVLDGVVARILAEQEIQRLGRLGVDLKLIERTLEPEVHGQSLRIGLDRKQILKLVRGVVTPGLVMAREEARLAASISHFRGVSQGLQIYAAEHEGTWPDDLDALVQAGMIDKRMLQVAHRPAARIVYRKPPMPQEKLENPSRVVVLYESVGDNWPGRAIVGFADGHVEVIRDAEGYRKLIGGK
jgi:prepilin-type processing-associated H-X9-DG protein